MLFEFKLPDLGEGIHEAEVLSVEIKPGDMVKEDQLILSVETDKAAVEITSPVSGKVQEIRIKVGDIVTVGSIMVTFETSAVSHSDAKAASPAAEAAPAAKTSREPVAAKATAGSEVGAAARSGSNIVGELANARPIPATPATRRLARELGVDLRLVPASGPAGRVMKEDVRSFAATGLEPLVSDPLSQRKAAKPEAKQPATSGNGSPQSLTAKYGGGGAEGQAVAPSLNIATPVALPDFSKFGKVERVLLGGKRPRACPAVGHTFRTSPSSTRQT
jgi:pyruvate dehydrogenase E2 component (dihydrolipoamide acetyltransferase)